MSSWIVSRMCYRHGSTTKYDWFYIETSTCPVEHASVTTSFVSVVSWRTGRDHEICQPTCILFGTHYHREWLREDKANLDDAYDLQNGKENIRPPIWFFTENGDERRIKCVHSNETSRVSLEYVEQLVLITHTYHGTPKPLNKLHFKAKTSFSLILADENNDLRYKDNWGSHRSTDATMCMTCDLTHASFYRWNIHMLIVCLVWLLLLCKRFTKKPVVSDAIKQGRIQAPNILLFGAYNLSDTFGNRMLRCYSYISTKMRWWIDVVRPWTTRLLSGWFAVTITTTSHSSLWYCSSFTTT